MKSAAWSHRALLPTGLLLALSGCATVNPSTATLQNTYWKLLRLGEAQVTVGERQREPHMILQLPGENGQRVAGFSGCNRLTGSYTLDGERIAFTQMAGTLMACAEGMETERAFHTMLLEAVRWTIHGEQLELFNAAGTRIASFGSVYLR